MLIKLYGNWRQQEMEKFLKKEADKNCSVVNGDIMSVNVTDLATKLATITNINSKTSLSQPKLTPEQRDLLKLEKERIKLEREKIKLERDKQRAELKAQRDAEKKAKLEQQERLKEERRLKREKKEEEQKRKIQLLQEKQEARKLKEKEKEERQLAEQALATEKFKKEQEAKNKFMGFFKSKDTSPNVKPGVLDVVSSSLMTVPRQSLNESQCSQFDRLVKEQCGDNQYLNECKKTCRMTSVNTSLVDSSDVKIVDPTVQYKKFKFLKFHDNHRPAYYGTWSKTSKVISSRNPYKKDQSIIDYDIDSDMEWEEEEPGESLSNSEEEDESGDDDDDEDGFFVPHGYLSEGEGELSDGEQPEDNKVEKQMAKVKAWEANFNQKYQPLVPVKIGLVWNHSTTTEMTVQEKLLTEFAAIALVSLPITIKSDTPEQSCKFPNEVLPDLIRLVHNSPLGLTKLVNTFQKHWELKMEDSSDTDCSYVSKKQLKLMITTIASKEICPPSQKPLWYVNNDILQQFGLINGGFIPLSPMGSYTKSNIKRGIKRCHGEVTPTMKPLQEFFKTPPSNKLVSRCLHLNESNEVKKPRIETTPTSQIILSDDSMDEAKENHTPTLNYKSSESSYHSDNMKQSEMNYKSQPQSIPFIDWQKQLLDSNKITIPIDLHMS